MRPGTQAPRRRHHRRRGQPRPGQRSAAATAAHAIFSWGSEPGLAWGYRHLPSCCPLEDLGGAAHSNQCRAQNTRALWETRSGGGGWGCVFPFPNLDFTEKLPGRRLCPGVQASPRCSFPSLVSAPASPASRSLGSGLAAGSISRRGPLAPGAPGRPAHSLPRLRGSASPRGETRRPGALQGDTRCLPRNS